MASILDKLLTIGGNKPRDVAKTVILLTLFGYFTGCFAKSIAHKGLKKTLFSIGFKIWKTYQGEKGLNEQTEQARNIFKHSLYTKEVCNTPINRTIPKQSVPSQDILKLLKKWSLHETDNWNGKRSMSSGAVYHGGKDLSDLQCKAYTMFSIANPLHPDVFPFTRKMESEIIAMTISYFNGNPYKQKGLLTSGGTESILMAIRAYKNWGKAVKNIEYPELIVPQSAHSAFAKACEMYKIKFVPCPIDPNTFTVDPKQMKKLINSNTIAMVGSAPQYAQGVLDPIAELSKLALEHEIGLHVDCCLGSFLLPTLQKMGYEIPAFDFIVPGVTTISADTHKFGYASKGTSVVMFRDVALRRHAYFVHCESSIGLYCTPTIQGSRSGGIVASAWSCLMTMGQDGYQREAALIMEAVKEIKDTVASIDGIKVGGNPCMSVVGIVSDSPNLNVLCVSDALKKRGGWIMNNCKDPPCAHICVTRASCIRVKERFGKDLRDSVNDILSDPEKYKESPGAMYGVLVSIPDTTMIASVMHEYLDVMLDLVDNDDRNKK